MPPVPSTVRQLSTKVKVGVTIPQLASKELESQLESRLGSRLGSKLESQLGSMLESLASRALASLRNGPLGKMELAGALGQKTASGSLHQVVRDLVEKGLVERTIPDKPNSRLQRYRLTPAGEDALARSER